MYNALNVKKFILYQAAILSNQETPVWELSSVCHEIRKHSYFSFLLN